MEHTMMTARELRDGLGTIAAIGCIGMFPCGLYYNFVKKKNEYSWRLKIGGVCASFVSFFMGLSLTVYIYKQEYLSIVPLLTDKNPEYVFHIFACVAVYGMWVLLNCFVVIGIIWADELADVVYKGENVKKTRKDFLLLLFYANVFGLITKFACKV